MINLGNICEGYGRDDESNPDYKGAMKWYTKATQLGDQKAKLNLGNLYHYGHGVRKTTERLPRSIKSWPCQDYRRNFYMGLYFQKGFSF